MSKQAKVTKLANVLDLSTGDASEVFRYAKVGGGFGEIAIPRDDARKHQKVRDLLIRKNANLPYPNGRADVIVKAAIKSVPAKRLAYARKLGWQRNRRCFVTARGVIGPQSNVGLKPPLWLGDRNDISHRRKGSRKAWVKKVAQRCGYSSCGMLVVSAAFAAPLLSTVGLQSFGLNLFGRSKVGKTAALLAAGSVTGVARESQLLNFAATNLATTENAQFTSDSVLLMNEVGLLSGGKTAAYATLRDLIYRLSEGRDRQRHTSWEKQRSAGQGEFRTIFVFTAEHSINEYARKAAETRDEGEYARCLDVPATSEYLTIIDRVPRRLRDARQRRKQNWARRQVICLRKSCEEHHGKVFSPYIKFLIEKGEELKASVEVHMSEFMRCAPKVEGPLQHAARNFALLYAGGRLGIEAGILPWKPARLLNGVLKCFEDALAVIGTQDGPESETEYVERILKERLEAADIVNRSADSKFGPKDHEGYRLKENGKTVYTIHAKAFRAWFGDNHRLVQAAIALLKDRQLLRAKNSRKPCEANGSDWFEQSPRWPNGRATRSIVFASPQ